MPIGADRCSRAAFWAVQVDLVEQDSISLYWREHLSSSGPPGRQRVSSLPPCHCKWLFLSFAELPGLLLQPHPHPPQPPGQVPLLQLFIKRVVAIIANTFRSIWKPCSFWGYNDATVITTLVIGERQGEVFWGVKPMRKATPGLEAVTDLEAEDPRPDCQVCDSLCAPSSLHFLIYKLCLSSFHKYRWVLLGVWDPTWSSPLWTSKIYLKTLQGKFAIYSKHLFMNM